MMKVGSKWELYLPSSLAYGDNGYGPNIEPGSTLIFEMELIGIEAPAPRPPPAGTPLTSDIIRVPSAEELKKGAKIEVIKAEDLEKMTNAAATNATNAAPRSRRRSSSGRPARLRAQSVAVQYDQGGPSLTQQLPCPSPLRRSARPCGFARG